MHHTFGSVKGDTLCPLGFHPQVRWPTRCKRCFRDYKDHSGKRSLNKVDTTSSSPSLSRWEPSPNRSSESPESKRIWASTSNLAKDENQPKISTSSASAEWSASAIDIPSLVESSTPTWQEDSTSRSRNFTGSKSESFHHRRHSIDETSLQSSSINDRPAKLQIKQVINKTSGNSENDVEFIIQVRKKNKAEIEDAVENKEKSETENLKTQLSELKARCEKAEREKSEILLRRLATMDSKASKSSEISRLQKSLKELTSKNEALTEEKTTLLAKLKNLEKENESKGGVKSERERATEELKSKLKAAETLCESLMDENEDMKKEIRELEEEIYEMQDNFREEQADEYTNLRKSLEQSNKNCRILSFKLRKLERKTEQLETEKNDLENKYDETRKIDEIMKKISNDFKNKKLNKNEHTIKSELKKTLENIGKELGDSYVGFMNIMQLGLDSPGLKEQDSTLKYDKLIKDNELLQQKLDNALKELANEKESNKSSGTSLKNDPLNLKKKLNEATAARESERKAWDLEKTKLQEEKEKLKSKLLSLSAEKLKIYNEVLQLKKDLEIATSSEKNNAKMEATINDLKKELSSEKEKCKKLQDDLIISTEKESRVSKNLAKMEQTKTTMESELKRLKSEFESIKSTTSTKLAKVTGELVEVKKDRDKLKSQVEEDKIAKDNEVGSLKKKISALEKAGANAKKMNELKQTYTEKIAILEEEMKKGQEQFDDLHTKHAALQDVKRELESQVEMLNRQTMEHKNALESAETRLKTLEENMKAKENSWSKEKVRLEEMLRERERSMAMNVQFEEFREEASRLGKENESLRIQLEDMKKNNDDLSSKLNDYNAVTKIQRNLSADSSALDTELRKTKNALVEAEKTRKTDLAQCKMRYEQRIKAINDEIQSIQNQLSRYKRERDTYKHMLEGAQRTIAELKSTRQRRPSTTSTGKSDEDEESTGTNISTLERQISMMEDELSESKLETSKLKTELVSERSGWQIKLSEMQSRINELEEERILASGRTKIPGLKARIELAWQKEREEQQRLLQETATLARDLRQTLYEVERERDKERLENKRRQEQTKKIFDEEKEESKKKLIELQCDLLELRDAHAKLRTSNEKMRREKERHEREREEFKDILANKRRMEQIEAKNINVLLKQVDDLMRLFPELSGKTENNGKMDNYTPTPPRRTKGPKSRESSPMLETKDEIKGSMTNLGVRSEKLEYTIKKLMEVTKEIQETKKLSVGNEFSSKKKLTKRSSSIDDDSGRGSSSSRSSRPSLKRKSLSLEQTSVKNDQLIWGTDSNVSSMQSLDSEVDTRHFSMQRDSSVDSRLSGGSTKSEILHKDKKYNKNLIRKITTKLTKSASVDDPSSSYDFGLQTSGSEASIIDDSKSEKKNLKKKLSDMFKRSSSKSNGLNKKSLDESSRPASRTSNTSRR